MQDRTIYVGLGSNLGDRYSTLAQAIQGLRRFATLTRLSSLYETEPVGVDAPFFYNIVAQMITSLPDDEIRTRLAQLEQRLGRAQNIGRLARTIDLDLIDLNQLATQPYYLVAMAELDPAIRDPHSGGSLADSALSITPDAVRRLERSLTFAADRQSGPPDVALAIDRVGVDRLQRNIRLRIDGRNQHLFARFTLTSDLGGHQAGVHMSRFSEHLETATLNAFAQTPQAERLDLLLREIAQAIIHAQQARQADVHCEADFTLERWTPVSGTLGEEHYRIIAHTRATADTVKCVLGVEVEGITACPCAQLMMREQGTRELLSAGFSFEETQRALDVLPAATHNQRGRGRVLLGLPPGFEEAVRFEDLVELVEQSLSSETYELLKRPDEFFVVNKAHRNPKFVEDVVRGILMRVLDFYQDFPDATFVEVSQVNDESIHKHDAVAFASGTFGEFRAEMQSRSASLPRTSRDTWFARISETAFP